MVKYMNSSQLHFEVYLNQKIKSFFSDADKELEYELEYL
jgi:hypothetical protein